MSDLMQQTIVAMEEQARRFDLAAAACRDCAEKIRAALALGVDSARPVARRRVNAAPRKAARTRARSARPATQPATPAVSASSPAPAVRDLDDRDILQALSQSPRPLARREVFNSLPDPRPAPLQIRRRLQRLASFGTVECRGTKSTARYWTREQWASLDASKAPRVEADRRQAEGKAPAEPAAPAVNSASPLTESAKLRAEIRRVLASGASYDPKEIVRNVRGAYPDINAKALIPVLESMAKAGECRRVSMDFGPARYQSALKGRRP